MTINSFNYSRNRSKIHYTFESRREERQFTKVSNPYRSKRNRVKEQERKMVTELERTRRKDGRRNLKKKRKKKQQDITDFILNLSSFLEDPKKPPSILFRDVSRCFVLSRKRPFFRLLLQNGLILHTFHRLRLDQTT